MKGKSTFVIFVKENPMMVISSIIILLLCYGFRMFNYFVTIDAISMVVDYQLMFNTFIESGRFGYAFTKLIFNLDQLDSNFSLLLMGLTILLYSFLFCYLFYLLNNKKKSLSKLQNILFPSIFISTPIFAEQYNYTLQSFEIAFAMFLLAIALISSAKWILENNKVYFFITVLSLTYSIATYQSFAVLYVSGAIASYLYVSECSEIKQCYNFAAKQLFAWLCSIILYYVCNYCIQKTLGLSNSYVGSLILWQTEGVHNCIKNIVLFLSNVFSGQGIFYNSIYLVVFVGMLIYAFDIIKKKQGTWFFNTIAIIGLLLSPFLMPMAMGTAGPIRAQMSLPFVSAFGVMFLIRFVGKNHLIKGVSLLYCFSLIFQQCKETSKLFYSDYMRYEGDVALANAIATDINKTVSNDYENIPVVFVGQRHASLPQSCVRGEIMGYSFFEFGHNSQWGNLPYLIQFFNSLGYKFTSGSNLNESKIKPLIESMNSWPADNSIRIFDDTLIVKLSND